MFKKAKMVAVQAEFRMMLVKTESANKKALLFYDNKEFVKQKQVIEEMNNQKIGLIILKLGLKEK